MIVMPEDEGKHRRMDGRRTRRMKSHKRTIFQIAGLSMLLTLAIVFALPIPRSYLLRVGMFLLVRQVEQGQTRLLCETNHRDLLAACRELSKQAAAGKLSPRIYYTRNPKRFPEVRQFPKVILDVHPRSVSIDKDGRVVLQMGGGFANYGIVAYPEGYKEPHRNFEYGDREIIDGLWYHDAEYEGSPKHQNTIESLIQKGRDAGNN